MFPSFIFVLPSQIDRRYSVANELVAMSPMAAANARSGKLVFFCSLIGNVSAF
jgi:hypothetical protein